jgi:hypothetical protein
LVGWWIFLPVSEKLSRRMEFPADWTVLPKENFDLAVPRIEGLLTMELLAELRPSWAPSGSRWAGPGCSTWRPRRKKVVSTLGSDAGDAVHVRSKSSVSICPGSIAVFLTSCNHMKQSDLGKSLDPITQPRHRISPRSQGLSYF